MRAQAVYSVAALAAAVLLLAATAAAQPTTGRASRLQIAIHEQGTQHHATGRGVFTIDLALPGFASSGKTAIQGDPGPPTYANGQRRTPFSGLDTFTSSKGQLEIAFSGTHIDVNTRATATGEAVGPAIESGMWKIKSATGVYQGWKGGGPWAAAIHGYTSDPSYSVEWDGYITR